MQSFKIITILILEMSHNFLIPMQIKRLKSLQESSNKLKQEKWVDEKTRRIKEQTVRGLEPEIQRLMARHTAELSNLESERERQLAAQERCYSLISVSEHGATFEKFPVQTSFPY